MTRQNEVAERHLRACEGFGGAVAAADGRWDRPSPCTEWKAREVLEHVIGFHDVLLLRPMGAKPVRPRDDPLERWRLTHEALRSLFALPGLFDGPIDVPAVGNNSPTQLDAAPLVAALTQDVLVHTWDLASAVEADNRLDPELCDRFVAQLSADPQALVASGMFGPAVDVSTDANSQTRLLASLGRDPSWQPRHG